MIIFRALLFAALPLLSAVAEVFDTETTNPPSSSSSKSAKSSNGDDDDIDFDEVVNLVDVAGGVEGVMALIALNALGDGEEDDTSSTRMLVEVPNPLDCNFAKYTCKNYQNTTVIAAVSTTEFAGFLNETTPCYIPSTTTTIRGITKVVPGSMKFCNTIATSFDAVRKLDGCVTVLELLKRTLQLKRAAKQRAN